MDESHKLDDSRGATGCLDYKCIRLIWTLHQHLTVQMWPFSQHRPREVESRTLGPNLTRYLHQMKITYLDSCRYDNSIFVDMYICDTLWLPGKWVLNGYFRPTGSRLLGYENTLFYNDGYQIQINTVVTSLVIFGAHMNILLLYKSRYSCLLNGRIHSPNYVDCWT